MSLIQEIQEASPRIWLRGKNDIPRFYIPVNVDFIAFEAKLCR